MSRYEASCRWARRASDGVAVQQGAGVVRREQPLVRVDDEGVRPLDPVVEPPDRGGEQAASAVGRVDVEPDPAIRAHLGDAREVVDRPGVRRARARDHREDPVAAVRVEGATQSLGGQPATLVVRHVEDVDVHHPGGGRHARVHRVARGEPPARRTIRAPRRRRYGAPSPAPRGCRPSLRRRRPRRLSWASPRGRRATAASGSRPRSRRRRRSTRPRSSRRPPRSGRTARTPSSGRPGRTRRTRDGRSRSSPARAPPPRPGAPPPSRSPRPRSSRPPGRRAPRAGPCGRAVAGSRCDRGRTPRSLSPTPRCPRCTGASAACADPFRERTRPARRPAPRLVAPRRRYFASSWQNSPNASR